MRVVEVVNIKVEILHTNWISKLWHSKAQTSPKYFMFSSSTKRSIV